MTKPFTDDDLAALKALYATDPGDSVEIADMMPILARLEAAEAHLKHLPEHVGEICSECLDFETSWRKAAGK